MTESIGRCSPMPVSMRHAMSFSDAICIALIHFPCTMFSICRSLSPSKARWIYPLTDPRPLRQLYQRHRLAVVFLTSSYRYPKRRSPTMNAFSIPLRFPIKDCIFIFRSHLRLCWHFLFPPLQFCCRLQTMLLKGIINGRYDIVDQTKAFALTPFLGSGETPRYFPVNRGCQLNRNDKECTNDQGWRCTREGLQREVKLS